MVLDAKKRYANAQGDYASNTTEDTLSDNSDWLDAFKQQLIKQDLSTRTIEGYLDDIRYFEKWLNLLKGEPVAFSSVAQADISAYRQDLLNLQRQKANSINRRLQSIKRLFQWAKAQRLLSYNPSEAIRFVRKKRETNPSALTKAEIHALLSVAGQSKHGLAKRNYALLQLLLQTGLRIGEASQLQWRDITLNERSGLVRVVNGKGIREREVPLNATARRALRDYLAEQRAPGVLSPDAFVFTSKRHRPATLRSLQSVIAALASKAAIQRINTSAHTLRHTFATYYLKANPGQLVELATLLGHESIHTTAIYTKATQESLADAVEKTPMNIYDE